MMAGRKKTKKKSFWSPSAVIGRAVWGRDGFGGVMRRVRREAFGMRTVASIRTDPVTDKPKVKNLKRGSSGWEYKPPRQKPAKPASRVSPTVVPSPPRQKTRTERVVRAPERRPNGSWAAARRPGLARAKCPWCRGTGDRVLFSGDGTMKTIAGILPGCNHRPIPARGHKPQTPAADTDFLFCLRCDDTGNDPDGGECTTCHGWVNKYASTY